MLDIAAFTYTLLAGFVLTTAGRNHRACRPNAPMLELGGTVLMAMSFTLAALMIATVAYRMLAI
jgi:hypothetical protein